MKKLLLTTIALTAIGVAVRANEKSNDAHKRLNEKPGFGAIDVLHERIDKLEKEL